MKSSISFHSTWIAARGNGEISRILAMISKILSFAAALILGCLTNLATKQSGASPQIVYICHDQMTLLSYINCHLPPQRFICILSKVGPAINWFIPQGFWAEIPPPFLSLAFAMPAILIGDLTHNSMRTTIMAICYLCYSKHTYMSLLLLDSLYNLPLSTTVLFIFESRNSAPIPHIPNEIGIKGGHSTTTCSLHKVISFLALVLLLNKAVNLRN